MGVEKVSGSADTLIPLFDEAFSKCKQVGLQVGLTTSHSAPYETDSPSDAKRLVESWCANGGDLDLISPQLYTTGYETAPDFAVTSSCASVGCGWELYHNCNPKFVPSIVKTATTQQSRHGRRERLGCRRRGSSSGRWSSKERYNVQASKRPHRGGPFWLVAYRTKRRSKIVGVRLTPPKPAWASSQC